MSGWRFLHGPGMNIWEVAALGRTPRWSFEIFGQPMPMPSYPARRSGSAEWSFRLTASRKLQLALKTLAALGQIDSARPW
jgi:hypothetical protein